MNVMKLNIIVSWFAVPLCNASYAHAKTTAPFYGVVGLIMQICSIQQHQQMIACSMDKKAPFRSRSNSSPGNVHRSLPRATGFSASPRAFLQGSRTSAAAIQLVPQCSTIFTFFPSQIDVIWKTRSPCSKWRSHADTRSRSAGPISVVKGGVRSLT